MNVAFPLIVAGLAAAAVPPSAEQRSAWLEIAPLSGTTEFLFVRGRSERGFITADTKVSTPSLVCGGSDSAAIACALMGDSDQPARVPASFGRQVRGRLLVGEQPLPGARIGVIVDGIHAQIFHLVPLSVHGHVVEREVPTNKLGAFNLPPLAPGRYRLQIRVPNGRLLHSESFVIPASDLRSKRRVLHPFDLGDIPLDKGATVDVFVSDSRGRPLREAVVTASQGSGSETSVFPAVQADEAGRVRLYTFGPGGPVRIRCSAAGFIESRHSYDSPPPSVECVLLEPGRVAGQVFSAEDMRPVAGAVVSTFRMTLAAEGAGGAWDKILSAQTAEDGSFLLEGLSPGEHNLRFVAPGFDPTTTTVSLYAGAESLVEPVHLAPSKTRTCHVVDAGTKLPVPQAHVLALAPAGLVSEMSGAGGEFRVPILSHGETLLLQVQKPGYARTVLDVADVPSRAECAVQLGRGGQLKISVWEEDSDSPCVACIVVIDSEAGGQSASVSTDAYGHALSELLAPGTYRIGVTDVKALGGIVTVRGGENVQRADVIEGAVTRVSFGRRIVHLRVDLSPTMPESWQLMVRSSRGAEFSKRLLDGRFDVRRPAGEGVDLLVSDGVGLEVLVGMISAGAEGDVSVPLPDGALRGRILRGDSALAGATVELRSSLQSGRIAAVPTDESGTFAIPYLASGRYELSVGRIPARTVTLDQSQSLELGAIALPPN